MRSIKPQVALRLAIGSQDVLHTLSYGANPEPRGPVLEGIGNGRVVTGKGSEVSRRQLNIRRFGGLEFVICNTPSAARTQASKLLALPFPS